MEYYKAFYRPGNSILGVTGDVTPRMIVAKVEKTFSRWETGTAVEPNLTLKGPIVGTKIILVNRPNSVQTYVMLANRAIGRLDPDYIACQVLNRILGDGPASRLFRNIREQKGYTYGISSGFAAFKYLNYFSAGGSFRTEVTSLAIDDLFREFRDIHDHIVPEDELENAKHAVAASFALSIENQFGVLRQILSLREYGLSPDYWDTYPSRVMALTGADIQRVAQKYIPIDNVQLVAVGDASNIRDLLLQYGTVEEYSIDGEKVRYGH